MLFYQKPDTKRNTVDLIRDTTIEAKLMYIPNDLPLCRLISLVEKFNTLQVWTSK